MGPADNWEEQFDSIDMTNKKGEDAVLFVVIDELSGFQKFCGEYFVFLSLKEMRDLIEK